MYLSPKAILHMVSPYSRLLFSCIMYILVDIFHTTLYTCKVIIEIIKASHSRGLRRKHHTAVPSLGKLYMYDLKSKCNGKCSISTCKHITIITSLVFPCSSANLPLKNNSIPLYMGKLFTVI